MDERARRRRSSAEGLSKDPSLHEMSALPPEQPQGACGWFERVRTRELKLGAGAGYYGKPEVPKLLSYNPNQMWTFWGVLFNKQLTSFHGQMQYHVTWAFVIPISFVLLLLIIDDFKPIVDGKPQSARKWAILFEDMMDQASGDFRGLIGYVLGGFVARAFTMWYLRRKNYAAFCGTCRNLILQVAAAVPMSSRAQGQGEQQPDATTLTKTRSTLGRWAILAHELGSLKGRGAIDSEDAKVFLLDAGLLVEGEWETMVDGDRHTTVLWWILLACQRLNRAGVVAHHQMSLCAEAVGAMRAKANDLMSSLDRDIPYPYASLLGMLVKTNVALMTFWRSSELYLNFCGTRAAGQTWGTAHEKNRDCHVVSNSATLPNHNEFMFITMVFVQLSTLFLWNISYKAMYDLAKVLHNPFGNRQIDVAHETISAGLRNLADQLLGNGEAHLPPDMPPER